MNSRIAQETEGFAIANKAKRGDGRRRQLVMFESSRIADQIGNMDALPVKSGAEFLQNEAGEFYFRVGYSAIGGGDVIE